jgi:hypothetical protein
MSRDTFAEALGVSSKTGPFGGLVGSIAQYGLADTGDGYIRYTELAKRILFGERDDAKKAKKQAVSNVTLFNDLFHKFGRNISEEEIRLFLRESSGIDIADAPSVAVEVSKIFKKVTPYFDLADMKGELLDDGTVTRDEGITASKTKLGEVRTNIGSVVMTNKSTIRLAIKHLEVLLEQLEEEEKAKGLETGSQQTLDSEKSEAEPDALEK